MTNEEKLKDLLIEMGFIDEKELQSRNDLFLIAYEIDNDMYKISTEGLPDAIYEKVNLWDSALAHTIIYAISDLRKRINEFDRTLEYHNNN